MKTNDIKKGMNIKTGQLGTPVSGVMLDSQRGNTRLVDVKGSEVGMLDEMGSVYSHDIIQVEVDGEWEEIEYTEAQLKLKKQVSAMGW